MKTVLIDCAGELKIVVSRGVDHDHGLLRLREPEDGGCLWRLRWSDGRLGVIVKRIMEEMD